ncbi:MAG: hypothetical protein IJ198_05205 [Lachnospiraceae bacterium]|nr:hypothetical protein [Lachnospiraceae bacterium]
MLFTRLPEKKYLLGVDIGETFCQISYLNTRRLTAGMDPHTFSTVARGEAFNIPQAAFADSATGNRFYGKEALEKAAEAGREPVTHLFAAARQETGEGGNLQILIGYLQYCFSLLSAEVTAEEIEALTFTVDVCDRKSVEILRAAADRLFPGLDKVAYEEHLKSFYHYVLTQDEEQRRQSVLLLDGWSEEELVLYTLSYNKKTRPIVCFPEELRLKIPADAGAAQKDEILCSAVRGLMREKEYSAAYLTGEALGGGWMKESLNLICRGRRAFQGDTLYSKGAADSTMAACGLSSKADKYFYLSKDALRCNIGMECLRKGRAVYQPLLDAGAEWYDAAAQIDILLEDGDEIVLRETSVDRGNEREIAVKLENMPKRPRATTRLRIRLHMIAADRMRLEAEDLGFGEIFPATGMKWEQEIVING